MLARLDRIFGQTDMYLLGFEDGSHDRWEEYRLHNHQEAVARPLHHDIGSKSFSRYGSNMGVMSEKENFNQMRGMTSRIY